MKKENTKKTQNEEIASLEEPRLLVRTFRYFLRHLKNKIKYTCLVYGQTHPDFRTKYNNALIKHRARIYRRFKKIPINDKMIVFESFMGRQYADSPKAIYKRLLEDPNYSNFKFVWAFKTPDEFMFLTEKTNCKGKKNTIVIPYNKKEYAEYMATAKYWITNSRIPRQITKKDGHVYIQCWHGTPLKRLGYDIAVGDNASHTSAELNKMYSDDSSKYSYMVSPSPFATEKFISAFDIKNHDVVHTVGYPRNDFLFSYTEKDVEAIKQKLIMDQLSRDSAFKDIENIKRTNNIDFSKKIILYAPTWRDNQHQVGQGYTYKLEIDFDRLKEKYGDEYIILFRAHYFISNSIDLTPYEGFVFDVSSYDDISELYVVSDILITDYSSVFFDYANLRRPMLFYMYDYEEYKGNMRDFYFDLEELPGPICQTQDELENALDTLDTYNEKYYEVYKKFCEKFNPLDNADCAKKVIDDCIIPVKKAD